jgi:hypothetical protein
MHFDQHATMFYTKQDRVQMGKPVDNLGSGGAMYAGMGGVTDMVSLVDGIEQHRFHEALPGEAQPALTGTSRRAIEGPRKMEHEPLARNSASAFVLFNTPHSLTR